MGNSIMFEIIIKGMRGKVLCKGKTERHQLFGRGREVELDGKRYLISESSFTIALKGGKENIFVVLTGNLNNEGLKRCRGRGNDSVLVIDHD